MMKTFLLSLFCLSSFLIQGCIRAPNNPRKNALAASLAATGKNNPTIEPTFSKDENLYWFTNNKITGTVSVNKDSENIIYLRGKLIHKFLNAVDTLGEAYYKKQYCLVGIFSNTVTYKQLRVRAIPITTTSNSKILERLLRVDLPSTSDNTAACNFTTIDTILPGAAAYSLSGVYVGKVGDVTTEELLLYQAKTALLEKVSNTIIDLSSIFLKIDFTSNSSDQSGLCTNSSCSSKGFDCCIQGQCVKDGSEKPNASSDSQYQQAKVEYAANPLSFINYPNIFYICSNIAHTPTSTTPVTTTPKSEAEARVAAYLKDYICITDVAAETGYTNCRNYDSNGAVTVIDQTLAAYTAIKKKLAIACGCTANESEMEIKCPDWGITPVYPAGALKTTANISDFACYTPAPTNPMGPIINLNVSVPNRSAPHRFYSSTGVNLDSLTGIFKSAPTTLQEGEDFYYLDELNKVSAINGSYNINSVLGQMTIDLTHTLPAKVVTVELGKSYILSAISGYFTPCSKCAKDSWFPSFSAFPPSKNGMGLQASGYSTARDSYSLNTTLGNYEDTKFGRACYVPVTMLPFTHQKNATLQTQRQNRLKTQAALFINGQQRDWYGFNYGALIGSFDGVTWFSVGTGRRITATSTKLFLALNASYLDLADRSDTVVNIIPDLNFNITSDYDYDPNLSMTDPKQNTGATCQRFHQCSVDADCIAQLGWEYTCADISQLKTKWPLYDTNALETVNQERLGTLFEILQNTIETSNGKRCVYRGAGAPCKRDFTVVPNDLTKKALTCAPNFYCASLTLNKFNNELSRSPNELSDMLFGMDANFLGRPLNYVTASKSLDAEIIANIKYNGTNAIGLSASDTDDMGLCRPGRMLTSTLKNAHSNPDNNKRTDYISQIGSCNSLAIGTNRVNTCPSFDSDLNLETTVTSLNQVTQNACGAEALHNTSSLSAFKNIEGLSLITAQNFSLPTLAKDACLRRAGSICHSDLDCSPNKLHEDNIGSLDIKYFGLTEAEKSYWQESLICGQESAVPALGSATYFDYKLSENRCCREIGKDFTMYTEGSSTLVPENTGTLSSLLTSIFSYLNPVTNYRYSRYTISTIAQTDADTIPKVTTASEPKPNQWKVIDQTGALTCCGGGWIRKFADGTHDWKVKNRLSLDSNNFSCLNYRSPLADASYTHAFIVGASFLKDYSSLCKYPDGSGCLQIPFAESSKDASNFTIIGPKAYDPADYVAISSSPSLAAPASGYSRIDTTPTKDPIDNSDWLQLVNNDAPYTPKTFLFPNNEDSGNYNFFTDKTYDYGVEFYLPAYVGWDNTATNPTFINKVYIKYFFDPPTAPTLVDITANIANPAHCSTVINTPDTTGPVNAIALNNSWCIVKNAKTQNRPVVIVKALPATAAGTWKYAGVVIDFKPLENHLARTVAYPGNALYYLSKLARLELTGIPQITYEPLYCNNNQENLVPGIFKSSYTTKTFFENALNSYEYASFDPIESYNADESSNVSEISPYGNQDAANKYRYTYQDKLQISQIFSSKDFTCCTPLGKSPTVASKCCSGYAVTGTDSNKTLTCKLPVGTDLNVYFNKFVSSEGVGENLPSGGLIVDDSDSSKVDFNPYTGEPKYRGSTYDKLVALGNAYCDGGTVATGGAFGAFPPEPFSGSYVDLSSTTGGTIQDSFPMSIVDSIIDYSDKDPNLGKVPFDSGYKWNHHYYCK